jgi:hypothetical protein
MEKQIINLIRETIREILSEEGKKDKIKLPSEFDYVFQDEGETNLINEEKTITITPKKFYETTTGGFIIEAEEGMCEIVEDLESGKVLGEFIKKEDSKEYYRNPVVVRTIMGTIGRELEYNEGLEETRKLIKEIKRFKQGILEFREVKKALSTITTGEYLESIGNVVWDYKGKRFQALPMTYDDKIDNIEAKPVASGLGFQIITPNVINEKLWKKIERWLVEMRAEVD